MSENRERGLLIWPVVYGLEDAVKAFMDAVGERNEEE